MSATIEILSKRDLRRMLLAELTDTELATLAENMEDVSASLVARQCVAPADTDALLMGVAMSLSVTELREEQVRREMLA